MVPSGVQASRDAGLPEPRILDQAGHREAAAALARAIGVALPARRLAAGAA